MSIKKESYEYILDKCYNFIKLMANQNKVDCIFEIPKFIYGKTFPSIDQEECAYYIIEELNKNNFLYYFFPPDKIYISWFFIVSRPEGADKNPPRTSSV
jgi:hypothetical protein